MSANLAKAEELIALTTRLTALIEDDITTLKGKRPAMLARNVARRGHGVDYRLLVTTASATLP